MARWNTTTSPPLRAADLQDLLEGGLLLFPGSVDRFRNPLLFGQLHLLPGLEHSGANELNKYFNYFVSISKEEVKRNGYVLVLDCTQAAAAALPEFLELLHDYFPGKINKVYVIQRPTQETYVGRAYLRVKTLLSGLQGTTDYPRITLNSYPELQRVVDPSQIPSFFDGNFNFDQKLWVETRIELEKLLTDYQIQTSLISREQECLIKPIPSSLTELVTFEKTIRHLRDKVYVPVQVTVTKAASLLAEEGLSRSEAGGNSRFSYCPLSVIHCLDLKLLHETHSKLSDINDNFLNLWGLQLQKVYLEKFTICHALLSAKLEDLHPTVQQRLELGLGGVEAQYHFYSSLHTTLLSDDCRLYECVVESHAALRDWTYTTTLPTDDLDTQTTQLNQLWGSLTSTVASRRKVLESYNKLRDVILRRGKEGEALHRQICSIGVSEEAAGNVALPIRHHTFSDLVQNYSGEVRKELEPADTSRDLLAGNIHVAEINKAIKSVLQKAANLQNLNHQCLAIKEQISLFFTSIKEIQDWLEEVGHPFITSQTLGVNLEESKQGKTKFLKFIANSGLDETKKKITQCTKTLTVILNSQFLDDRSVNIIRDTFTRTEVDWKGFGLEVQEHGRDLELSIEFYEAAQSVATWLSEEEGNRNSIIHVDEGGVEDLTTKMEQLTKFKKAMNRHSSIMDDCHSKYIALSASSNATLRHIRKAKTNVDSSWTRFSEQLRAAERLIEKKHKEHQHLEATSSISSMESLDFENEVEHTAFRNTKLLIQELVNTERKYVTDLSEVVSGYKVQIEADTAAPRILKTNTGILFGNIEDIYNFHSKIFLTELEKSLESNSVGSVFCTNIGNFDMYATYCKNKPHSENLLSNLADNKYLGACQTTLHHTLDLSSYLLKPVQRIMKYHLILEKLLKYAPDRAEKRREELNEALCIMEQVPRYANNAIHLMGLEGYSGNFEDLGQLLLQENFLVFINGQKRPTPRQIFTFEHAILFSKPVPVKPSSRKMSMSQAAPKYSYKNHFMLAQIGLTRFLPDDVANVQFQLNIYKKNQKHTGETYVLQANNTALRDQWMNRIEQLLFLQFENMKNRAASNML